MRAAILFLSLFLALIPAPAAFAETPAAESASAGMSVPAELRTSFSIPEPTVLSVACGGMIRGTARGEIFDQCAAKLSEWTGGKVTLNLYDGGILGSNEEMLEALSAGTVDLLMSNQSGLYSMIPELGALSVYGLHSDLESYNAALSSFTRDLEPCFAREGLHLTALYCESFNQFTTLSSLNDADSLSRIRIRVISDPYHEAFWRCTGAEPVEMPSVNSYIGIQQGRFNAVELNGFAISDSQLYNVQKYLADFRYIPSFSVVTASTRTWDSLDKETRAALTQMFEYKRDLEISYYETQNRQNRQFARDHGMYVITSMPVALRWVFDAASQEVIVLLRERLGNDIIDRWLNAGEPD